MRLLRRAGLAVAVITGACVTDLAVGPRDASSLEISPAAPAIVVGEERLLLAIARDSRGIPFVGLPTVWSTSNAAVASVSSVGLLEGMGTGSATITATSGGKTAAATVTVTPAPVITLSATTSAFTGTPGAPDPANQTIDITNTGGGNLNDLALGTIAYGPGATGWLTAGFNQSTAPAILTLSAATGSLALGTYSATVPVTSAKASNSPRAVSVSFAVVAGAPATLALNAGDAQTATVNTAVAVTPAVIVRDALGNPVGGVAVTFAVTAGGGGITGPNPATTSATGLAQAGWVLGTAAGPNELTASATGLAGSPVTFTATATPDVAHAIAANAGTGQSATVNTAVGVPPAVRVTDALGNPVGGASVTFAVTAGGGTVTPTTAVTTNGAGIAQATSWTLGTTAGTNNNAVSATAAGLVGSPVVFTATADAGGATQLTKSAGDAQAATVNTAVGTAPRVVVLDAFGNPVAGTLVTFAVTAGGGSLTGPNPATTDPSGFAQIGWTLGTTSGSNGLSASVTGLPKANFSATGTPDVATQLVLSAGDGQSAQVGTAVATPPRVQARDQFGNGAPGVAVTFAVASGGGNLTGTNPATTDASGFAQIGWTLGPATGANSLTGTAAGLAGSPLTFTAGAIAGPATQITLAQGDGQSTTVNTAVAVPPQVLVRDALGNPVGGFSVTFAVAVGGGNISGANQLTNPSGLAQVGGWILGQTAGANTLTASATGLTGSPVTFSATGTAGAAAQIAVSAGNGQTATVNTAVATPPAVIVRDQFDNAVGGVAVTFAIAGGGGSLSGTNPATTSPSGIAQIGWTLGTTAGANGLTATAPGLAGSPVAFSATGTAGLATQIVKTAGDGQSATVGTPVATPPRVQARDQFGNGVGGVAVTFAVASGGGSLSGTNPATTDGSGFAQIGWTLGAATGVQSLSAAATGLTGSPLTFTAMATPAGPSQIAIDDGDGQTTLVGTPVPAAPRVIVRDNLNNPVQGVSVTFAIASGGGSLTGTNPATTDGNGLAQIGWTVGTTAGTNNNTLTATAPTVPGSPFVTFTASAVAGAATQIVTSAGNGQSATVNTAVATPPRVVVRDQHGNPVPGVSVTFAVTGGGGSLSGANPATTDGSGFASIGWTLGTTAGSNNNTLTATATGLTGSPVTFTASAVAGAATQIAVSTGDGQTATVNTAVGTPPRVVVRDAFGNPVLGVSVTFAVTAGGGSLSGTNPTTTTTSGFAQIGWTLGTTAGTNNNTLTATATGLTGSPVTFTATATAAVATQIASSAGDGQAATVNTAVATPPRVIVRDAFNNPVPGVSVTFAIAGGGGSLSGTNPATTDGSGFASIGWTLGATSGSNNNTLSASAPGLTGSPVTFTASANAGTATQIALSQGDNQTTTVNTTVGTAPRVLVRDALNNPVAGVPVSFAVTAGGGGLSGANPAITDGNGFAQISWTLGTTAGTSNNTLTATSAGLTGSPVTFTATATAGAATQIAVSQGQGQSQAVNTTLVTAPRVVVRDAFNNPVLGVSVTFAVTVGGGSLTGTNPVTTDGSGFAQIAWQLGTTAGANALTATASGLTGSPVTFNATGVAGAATQIVKILGDAQSAEVNSPVPVSPRVQVQDQFGNPRSGQAVLFAVTGGGGSLTGPNPTTTDASGFAEIGWTLGAVAGANAMRATATGLAGPPFVTFTANSFAAGATNLDLIDGNNQIDTVGQALPVAYQVRVTDGTNGVAGIPVSWAVTGGGGSISPPTSFTDVNGFATATRTLSGTVGTHTATASAGTLIGSPITFAAIAIHDAPSQIAVNAGNGQTATVNTAVATPPSVVVLDQFGNAVSGVSVTFTVTGGGGSVATTPPGGTVSTDAFGIAQTTSWTLGTGAGAGNNTLTATSTGLTGSPVTFTASATAGAATQIALDQGNNQTATVNTAVATPPRVVARDAFNNPVQSVSVTFAVTGGGGALSGTNPVTTSSAGFASIGWTLGTTAGTNNNTLTASASGLTGSPVTFTASGLAAGATQIALSQGNNQTATVNTAVGTPPRVLVRDGFNNPVAGVSVTFAVTGGGGSLTGTNPATTDGSGFAQIGWILGTAAGTNTNTLTATATGLTGSPVTFTASAAAGGATQIALSQGDNQTATVNTSVATAPRVLVRDAFDNPVQSVSVTFAVTGGGGSLIGTNPATTDGSGFAQIGWTLGTSAGTNNNTLTATAGGLTGSPVTFTASAIAGSATQIALSQGDGQTATVNTAVSTAPRVLVRDGFNNPVAGVSVTFAVTGGSGSLTGTNPPTTDGNGLAQIAWTLGILAGTNNNTLTAAATGLTGSPVTFTASATAGAPSAAQSSVAASSPITASAGGSQSTVTVTVRDQFNNAVSGATVTIAASGGGNTVTQPVGTTNTSGVATGTVSSTVAESKTIGATVNPGAVSVTQTATLVVNPAAVSEAQSSVVASPDTIAASSGGTTSTITVTARDQFSNPITGATVFLEASGSNNGLTQPGPTTNGSGQTTGSLSSTTAETKTVSATANGVAITQTASVTVTAAAAFAIALNLGDNQSAVVNTTVTTPPSVVVRDQFTNPVRNTPVTFAVGLGGGSVNPVTAVNTNTSGIAQVTSWTLGTAAGTNNNTLTATAAGLGGSPVTFTASATVGAPSAGHSSVAATSPITASSGSSQSVITVTVRDGFDNPISSANVTWSASGTNNTLTSSTGTTDGTGAFNLGRLSSTKAEAKTITAVVNGTVTITEQPSVVVSAAGVSAAQSSVAAAPGSIAASGGGTKSTITVTVRDAFANPIQFATVVLAATGGGNTVTQPVATTNASGVTTGTLSSTVAEAKTVSATAASTGITQTAGVTVTGGVPATIALNLGNGQSAVVNTAVGIAPSVVVRDSFTNVVQGASVTFAVTGGGGVVNPITALSTNSSGVAQVTSWTLGTSAGTNNNTLSATSTGLTGSPVVFTASALVGAPSAGASSVAATTPITACQTSCTAGTVRSTITITVRDGFSNPIQGASVSLAATGSNNTLGQPSGTTNGSGQISGTLSSFTAQSKTITATVNPGASQVVISQQPVVVVNPDVTNAAQSTVTRGTSPITACNSGCLAGTTASTITVTAKDQFGNTVINGTAVTISSTGSNNSFSPSASGTTTNGVYTANFFSSTAQAKTISAVSGGVGITQTAAVTVTHATASSIVVNSTNPQSQRVGLAVSTAPSVLVTDPFGNNVTGATVTFAIASGGGSLSGGTQTTSNGTATIGSWTLQDASADNASGLMSNTLSASVSPCNPGTCSTTFTGNAFYGWATHVASILSTGGPCASCHNDGVNVVVFNRNPNNIVGVNGQTGTACDTFVRVIAGNAAGSAMYSKANNTSVCGGKMPPSTNLTAAQLKIIRAWINNNALNN